jgi:hypothetical protein
MRMLIRQTIQRISIKVDACKIFRSNFIVVSTGRMQSLLYVNIKVYGPVSEHEIWRIKINQELVTVKLFL